MSPEQARGEPVDHRGDLFSLGCMLYECVTGTHPFRGKSSVDTLHRIIYSDPPPLGEAVPGTPSELQRIVRKSLAKDPDLRYQSARDLAIDLRDLKRELESQPSGAVRQDEARALAPGRWALVATATAAALGLVATTVLLMRDHGEPPRTAAPGHAVSMSLARLPSSGNVIRAAISPRSVH